MNGTDPPAILTYDRLHQKAITGWIEGKNSKNGSAQPIPGVFGGNFEVSQP